MPLPLVKVAIVTIRTFIRPFNTVLSRRVRYAASEHEKEFFYRFGMKAFEFENKIDALFATQGSHETGLPAHETNLEKVSRGAAINRGVETFIELTFFYGLLLSIAAYDMHKRAKESKA